MTDVTIVCGTPSQMRVFDSRSYFFITSVSSASLTISLSAFTASTGSGLDFLDMRITPLFIPHQNAVSTALW